MNNPLVVLAVFILAAVVAALIPAFLRDRDFKRQVTGKRPERKLREGEIIPSTKENLTSIHTETIRKASVACTRMEWRNANPL